MVTSFAAPLTNRKSQVRSQDETVLSVQRTWDYDKFSFMKGNRPVNELQVRRLMQSFQREYLISPILVNEQRQIIDGQHRFLAAKRLGLHLHFIVLPGYGLHQVQTLNENMQNWKKIDYLNSYCDLGHKPYLQMREFMQQFPELGLQVCESLLTNSVKGANNKARVPETSVGIRNFQEGHFTIKNLNDAVKSAEHLLQFKPHYDGFNRPAFVGAVIGLLKTDTYKPSEMIGKLSTCPIQITHCANTGQYKLLLEEIYNYRRREKVNLRY